MSSVNLQAIFDVIHEAEGLKRLLRHSWLSDGRQESVAEHTWRMAFMAILLHSELEEPVDIGKVLEMIIVHDVAEIRAGDFHAFKDVPANKAELELSALRNIVRKIDSKKGERIVRLWQEFEERKTPEAKFAQALDKLEVLIQHNEADISTWEEKEYDFNLTYAYDKVNHSQILKKFRDLVRKDTTNKINHTRRIRRVR